MKTNEIFSVIESANKSIKSCGESLRTANTEYTSLSRVLKDMQRKELMKLGYSVVFSSLGLPTDGSMTPAKFRELLTPEQIGRTLNKKGVQVGEEWVGIWGSKQVTDADGNKVFEADGVTPVMEPVLRKVTAWTPNKFFRVVAQSNAIKAQAQPASTPEPVKKSNKSNKSK